MLRSVLEVVSSRARMRPCPTLAASPGVVSRCSLPVRRRLPTRSPATSRFRRCSSPKGSGCACWFACRWSRCATSTIPTAASTCWISTSSRRTVLRDAATLWIADDIDIYEGDAASAPRLVEVRASLPSDRSFTSYDEALAHVTGPRLPDDTELLWSQGLLDVLFEYPIQSDQSKFSIGPSCDASGSERMTVLRFLPPDGAVRAFEFAGSRASSGSTRAGTRRRSSS